MSAASYRDPAPGPSRLVLAALSGLLFSRSLRRNRVGGAVTEARLPAGR